VQLTVASTIGAGVNSNLVADDTLFDALSGNAVLNGIPVSVAPADVHIPVDGVPVSPR
jgi:hypothetical protein